MGWITFGRRGDVKNHPLEIQLVAWQLVKWNAEKEIKVVQAKINRKIKRLKEAKEAYPEYTRPVFKNSNTNG